VARDVPRLVAPGRSEREIAADIDAALRRAGFERSAFDTIVASGPNSARPHARPTPRELEPGEGLVLDFGGVYDGYCVDLTRTLHTGPRPAALRRIFAAVVEAHAAAVAAVKPGVRASAIDAAARGVLERHGLGAAFGHGTGHGLGLEVHDEPRLTRAGTAHPDSVVQPGLTIEPGAYVPGVSGVRSRTTCWSSPGREPHGCADRAASMVAARSRQRTRQATAHTVVTTAPKKQTASGLHRLLPTASYFGG
jgi:Xaa-Pro aminopeptidase